MKAHEIITLILCDAVTHTVVAVQARHIPLRILADARILSCSISGIATGIPANWARAEFKRSFMS